MIERNEHEIDKLYDAYKRCQKAFNYYLIEDHEAINFILYEYRYTETQVLINAIEKGYRAKYGYFSDLTIHAILYWIEQENKALIINKD